MSRVAVAGAFDDLRSGHIRFLQEAARVGPVTVALWSDQKVIESRGVCKFPAAERAYVLEAIRFVERVVALSDVEETDDADSLPAPLLSEVDIWVMTEEEVTGARRAFCGRNELKCAIIPQSDKGGFPSDRFDTSQLDPARLRVLVTGCYDWFHSGHVRFFEECSQLGDLYVVVGHDSNVRLLKGAGHPLFPQEERRYLVGACRHVKQALISTGDGWMDAEPEIELVRPQIYAVNEDGDKPEKRQFCAEQGLEYVVLKRTPREGLPARSSSSLRGF